MVAGRGGQCPGVTSASLLRGGQQDQGWRPGKGVSMEQGTGRCVRLPGTRRGEVLLGCMSQMMQRSKDTRDVGQTSTWLLWLEVC